MNFVFNFCFLITLCCGVFGQVPHFGKCPDVKVKESLNVTAYLGDWYEITKFFFFIEGAETCIRANYSLKENGHIKVYNRGLLSNGTEDIATGDADVPDSSAPAKLAVTFNGSPRVPYWIVDTDYENYSLIWSCTDLLGVVQADFAWILSRKKTLEASTVERLKNELASYGVNTDSFRATVQDNCPY